MELLFLGGLFPEEMESEILESSKGPVQYAANKLQKNFIDGFLSLPNINLQILSAPFLGSYPKEYDRLYISGQRLSYQNVPSTFVPFCNFWGYRNISRQKSLKQGIRSFGLEKAFQKSIVVYSPHTPFLQAAVYAKKIDPSIHICLIVPDLPQFMNLNKRSSFLYKTLKQLDIKIFYKNLQFVDSFVLLTEYMKDKINIKEKPYTVIEGIVDSRVPFEKNEFNSVQDKKTLVYTGTLNQKFGILNLLKAFHAIKREDIELVICGLGDSIDIIQEYASKDYRIKYLGQVTNIESMKLQKRATILVNPRQNNEEFTKYSFPSKNMEYLLSGNPVIVYKLDGIPKEYDKYFFYVEDNSVRSLSRKIEQVLELTDSQRISFGNRAKQFILEQKNCKVAASKVLNMITNYRKR